MGVHGGLQLLIASSAGIVAGAALTFTLNNLVTFRDDATRKRVSGQLECRPSLEEIRGRAQQDGVAFFLPAFNVSIQAPGLGVAASNRGLRSSVGGGVAVWVSAVSGMIAGCDRCGARGPPEDPRDALIREQAQLIAAQAGQIAALEATVADLREQLETAARAGSRNSGNSSMPPSSDDLPGRKPPRKQRRAAERAEKKKRGKQPGSPGASMTWRSRTGPRITIPRARARVAVTWPMPLTWGLPGRISRRRSRPRRRSGCSTTCTSPGAPAAGCMPRPARRACRILRCRSGRGCAPWRFTWSSSSMFRWSGAGS